MHDHTKNKNIKCIYDSLKTKITTKNILSDPSKNKIEIYTNMAALRTCTRAMRKLKC